MCWVAWSTLTLPKHAGGLGFRDIETFNNALLAKIGWRLINDPNSLVARVLLRKYAWNSSFLDCTTPSSVSHGWRSILVGRELLRKGLGWNVGNGESIRVWQDPWISCDKPITPMGPPTKAHSNLRVSDLLCPLTNQWDKENVKEVLPQYENQIMRIFTSSAPSLDKFAWLPDKSGAYNTRSGYSVGILASTENLTSQQPINWMKNVWNIKTAPKLKDFI